MRTKKIAKYIVTALLCCIVVVCGAAQSFTPISRSLGGWRGGNISTEALWHNFASLAREENLHSSIFAASPHSVPGLSASGVAAGFVVEGLAIFGLRATQFRLEDIRQTQIEVLVGKPIGAAYSIGLSMGLDVMKAESLDSRVDITYSLCAAHDISDRISVYLLATDLMPVSSSFTQYSALDIGVSWQSSDQLTLYTQLSKPAHYSLNFSVGIDYRPVSSVAFRFGISTSPSTCSIGIDLSLPNLFDVHLLGSYHPVLGVTPGVGFTYPGYRHARTHHRRD